MNSEPNKSGRTAFRAVAAGCTLLALAVIMLGAYVRLSDAGLGCPDWPGCYGQVGAPESAEAIVKAESLYPERPVDSAKAWKEMIHRYLASTLGLGIILLAVLGMRGRKQGLPTALPALLVALVIFQGLLGMWTVTHLVNPTIVTSHLAGGLATLSLLWWLVLRTRTGTAQASAGLFRLKTWIIAATVLLCGQILLGGWTSTNYAAVACTEFPTCYGGLWWPATDFTEGFTLWRPLGVDYEFGVLDSAARTAIHLTHRLGALVVLIVAGGLAWRVLSQAERSDERRLGWLLALVLAAQLSLGITNVVAHLPLGVAVAHNGGAALLFLTMLWLLHRVVPDRTKLAQDIPT